MDSIKRREFLKATAVSGIAISICDAHGLLMAGEAQTIGAPLRSAAWPSRRLLDLLKVQLPIVQGSCRHPREDTRVQACRLPSPSRVVLVRSLARC
jgi:hypothetical protein